MTQIAGETRGSYLFSYVRRSTAAVAVALLLAGMPVAGALAQDAAPGSLDAAFGAGEDDGTPAGIVSISFSDYDDVVMDVDIEADGHIVIAGNSYDGDAVMMAWIARMNADGTLDETFGVGEDDGTPAGIVAVQMGEAGGDEITAVTVEEDGHILVGGTHNAGDGNNAWVARMLEDGSLDEAFGAAEDDGTPAGFVSLSLGDGEDEIAAIQADANGMIVVAGSTTSTDDGTSSMMVARLTADGELDATFGAGEDDGSAAGIVTISLGDADDEATALYVEADGHIVVAGDSVQGDSSNLMVARLLADGTMDATFGVGTEDGTPDGVVNVSLGDGDETAAGVEVDEENGHVFVLGNSTSQDGTSNFFIVDLDETGELDEEFAAGAEDGTEAGIFAGSISDHDDYATDFDIDEDGHIFVVGASDLDGDGNLNMFIGAVTVDGEWDVEFGADSDDNTPAGIVALSISDGADIANAVHIDGGNLVVVAGTADGNAIVARVIGN